MFSKTFLFVFFSLVGPVLSSECFRKIEVQFPDRMSDACHDAITTAVNNTATCMIKAQKDAGRRALRGEGRQLCSTVCDNFPWCDEFSSLYECVIYCAGCWRRDLAATGPYDTQDMVAAAEFSACAFNVDPGICQVSAIMKKSKGCPDV